MSKPKKANFFVKTWRNINPASSTFTFETQVVFHPAGIVTIVFVVPGKVTLKIGDGGNAVIEIDYRGKNIVHSVLSWVSLKSEIMSLKCLVSTSETRDFDSWLTSRELKAIFR